MFNERTGKQLRACVNVVKQLEGEVDIIPTIFGNFDSFESVYKMHVTCKCACLVVCYMMIISIGVGSSSIHAVRNLDMSLLHTGTWNPTTEYDIGAIQKWQAKRRHVMMDLMERQRLLDIKKAEAARQIAERRAKKIQLRTNVHQAFLEERMKADAMSNDKHQSPSLNDIFIPVHNDMRVHSGSNDLSNSFSPEGTNVLSGNIGRIDTSIIDNRVLRENIGVATRKEPIENISPVNKGVIVDNTNLENIVAINTEVPVRDSIAGDTRIVPKDSSVPDVVINGQINIGLPSAEKSVVDEENSPNTNKGKLHNDRLANKSSLASGAKPDSTISTTTIVPAENIIVDSAASVPEVEIPVGIIAHPVDVGTGELGTDPTQEKDLRTLENDPVILGPQEHALDVVINPNLNRLRGDRDSHTPESTPGPVPHPSLETTPLSVVSGTTTITPVDSTMSASSLTTSSVTNTLKHDTTHTLMTMLNVLGVKGGIDPNLSTAQLLQDENIRAILTKAVENITRLLSLESQTQSPRRVDVFHHVHMHTHDPHGHGSVETVLKRGGNPSDPLVSSPGFMVNDLHIVDLTQPNDPSEIGIFKQILEQQNHFKVNTSTDAMPISKPASDINNGGPNAVQPDPVRSDPLESGSNDMGGFHDGSISHALAGIPADTPRQVDIISILSSSLEDLTSKGVQFNNIHDKEGGQSVMAPTTVTPPSGDISTHSPPGGIQTINGEMMPMPQVSNFTPQSAGKDLPILSFLSAIRDRLKG